MEKLLGRCLNSCKCKKKEIDVLLYITVLFLLSVTSNEESILSSNLYTRIGIQFSNKLVSNSY